VCSREREVGGCCGEGGDGCGRGNQEQRETVDRLGCVTKVENGGNNGGRPRGKMQLLCHGEGERPGLRGEGAEDDADFFFCGKNRGESVEREASRFGFSQG